MPTYVYQSAGEAHCAYCVRSFNRRQKIADPPLLTCPECGAQVRRVITAPGLAAPKVNLAPGKLGESGFTQYRRLEQGVYEKTAGEGPALLQDKPDPAS